MSWKLGIMAIAVLSILIGSAASPYAAGEEETVSTAIDTYFAAVKAYRAGSSKDALNGLKKAFRVFKDKKFKNGQFLVRLMIARIRAGQAEYDKAKAELKEAQKLKSDPIDIRDVCLVQLLMAKLEIDLCNFVEARTLLEQSLSNAEQLKAPPLKAAIRTYQARILITRGEYDKAAGLLKKSIEVFQDSGDIVNGVEALMELAKIHRLLDNYEQSVELLNEALNLAGRTDLESLPHRVLVQQALAIADQGSLTKARAMLVESLAFFTKTKDAREASKTRTCLASVLIRQGDLKQSYDLLKKASKGLRQFKARDEEARNLLLQGRVLTEKGKLIDAAKELAEARATFGSLESPRGAMLVGLAETRLQLMRGQGLSAMRRANTALDLAKKLRSRLGKAEALQVKAMISQALKDDVQAVGEFDSAGALFRDLKLSAARARCLVGQALSLVRLGFIDEADHSLERAWKIAGNRDDLLGPDILLRKGQIAAARGDYAEALKEYKKAGKDPDKFSRPLKKALVLEARARVKTEQRQIRKASLLWEDAGQAYKSMAAPGGVVRCLTARVNLELDKGDCATAERLAPRSLKVSQGNGSSWKNYIRLAQASRSHHASVIFGPSEPLFPKDRSSLDDIRPSPYGDQPHSMRLGEGPDRTMLNAHLAALRARVASCSGKSAEAEKQIARALKLAGSLKNVRVSSDFTRLIALTYMDLGKYGTAPAYLKKSDAGKGWLFEHARAMALAQQDKRKESLAAFEKAIGELKLSEMRDGLWTVPPRAMRQRERLYEDYVDTLMDTALSAKKEAQGRKAWIITQMLKMRRILYDRSAIGVDAFPGVPEDVLNDKKKLQYRAINAVRRAKHPQAKFKGRPAHGRKTAKDPESLPNDVPALLDRAGSEHPRFVEFLRGNPPSIEEVQGSLSGDETYVSFLLTRRRMHGFLLGNKVFKFATVSHKLADLHKAQHSVIRTIAGPYRSRSNKALNDLWQALFGAFDKEIKVAKRLVIEPDGFLTMFPFEALIPGPIPASTRAVDSIPTLADRIDVSRTTSAFRFMGGRSGSAWKSASSVVVFARPDLPGSASVSKANRDTEGLALVSLWQPQLRRFRSSLDFKSSGPGTAIAKTFGDKGKLLAGKAALRSAFLSESVASYPLVHLLCPTLIPSTPVGTRGQPFLVFSTDKHVPGSAFCGITRLSAKRHAAELFTLTWLGPPKRASEGGLLLLLETLGFSGVRSVLLPLWSADRRGQADAERLMLLFYSSLKAGDAPPVALKKAHAQMESHPKRGASHGARRFVLF